MDIESLSKQFKELGHLTRLQVYLRVVQSGEPGIPVGELQRALAVPGSTLSHHISALVSAQLIHQRRDGRILFCEADYGTLTTIIDFLQRECCIRVDD